MSSGPNTDERLDDLVEILKDVSLDFNWILSIAALSAQELAIKKKLDEFGSPYPPGEDFQKLAHELEREFEKREIDVPAILLSVARSFRHIRAKLIHEGHKSKLSDEEATTIIHNTNALVKTLFRRAEIEVEIQRLIESIPSLSDVELLQRVNALTLANKKLIVTATLDEISLLDYEGLLEKENLFQFLRLLITSEKDNRAILELFEVFFEGMFQRTIHRGKDRLLSIVADLTRLPHIKKWIGKAGRPDWIVFEFKNSSSYNVAAVNAEIILKLASIFNKKQVNDIVEAALNNDQIHYSWGARPHLDRFLTLCSRKIPRKKLEELRQKLAL